MAAETGSTADILPDIRVTDPHSEKSRPVTASPPYSPVKPDNPGQDVDAQTNNHVGSVRPPSPQPPVDPLSQHIIDRTGTPVSSGSGKRRSAGGPNALGITAGSDSISTGNSSSEAIHVPGVLPTSPPKDKKKGISFLSRIIGHKKKHTVDPLPPPDDDKVKDKLADGDAEAFVNSFDGMAFSPIYPSPPSYVKVQSQWKTKKDFDRLFLAQELRRTYSRPGLVRSPTASTLSLMRRVRTNEDSNAIWAMGVSKDGHYLATAGQDKVVRVWATLKSRDARKRGENQENTERGTDGHAPNLDAPVFEQKPFRVFKDHTEAVLDLSWSKNNFLLSSSMDKTVRLWHVSREECLCAFKHNDFVTSIQFHPRDDRFFLAGSLDAKLRLWSIPDKSVAFWNQVPDMITAVSFTPDGKVAIAGSVSGLCLFYETEGLKYQTQMHVKSSYGKNAKGSKITGIETINLPPTDPNGDIKVLITSNDSRTRLYNLRDKSLEMKFKGNANTSSQIRARFSDDARYVICGSEDNRVFMWPLVGADYERKEKQPVEIFEAHSAATTVCTFAPAKLRQTLAGSGDPVYDICNPPPVKLLSKAEIDSVHSGRVPDDTSSGPHDSANQSQVEENLTKNGESVAYTTRSAHPGGPVIVTGDATGCIKVFRQDCAYEKRMHWDRSSMSRKHSSTGYLHRHSSVASSKRKLARQDSASTSTSHDRVLSWRQSIASTSSLETANSSKRSPHILTDLRSHRIGLFGRTGTRSPKLDGSSHSGRNSSFDTSSASLINGSPPMPGVKKGNTAATAPPPRPSQGTPAIVVDSPVAEDSTDGTRRSPAVDGHSESQDEVRPNVVTRTTSTNSTTYWQHDAWQDELVAQLAESRSRHKGDNTKVARGGMLGPSSRQASTVSRLTDEMSSNDEQ